MKLDGDKTGKHIAARKETERDETAAAIMLKGMTAHHDGICGRGITDNIWHGS